MVRSFTAYHGTTRYGADEILRTKYFHYSNDEDEWLGKGIYFFEDDILQAYDFCTKAREYTDWAIIHSLIQTDNYIDLVLTEHFLVFKELAKRLKSRYLKKANGIPRKFINAVVLNAMYEAKPYDLVRHTFPVPPGYDLERTNICRMQVQLCVRNRECINSIEEVSCNGY